MKNSRHKYFTIEERLETFPEFLISLDGTRSEVSEIFRFGYRKDIELGWDWKTSREMESQIWIKIGRSTNYV